ncbi:unnamed protein product, partial [Symbiodinium sp. KB8]
EDRLTFDAFGAWYNAGGFEVASWLELLDLKKFPDVPPPHLWDAVAAFVPGAEGEAASGDTVVLRYALGGSAPDLTFTSDEVDTLAFFLVQSRLPCLSPSGIASLVAKCDKHSSGLLDADGMVEMAAAILDHSGLLDDLVEEGDAKTRAAAAAAQIKRTIYSMCYGLRAVSQTGDESGSDDDSSVGVETAELVTALSVFAQGSKSEKLGATFHLFDADEDGALGESELWRFLLSIAVALHAGKGQQTNWAPLFERLVEVALVIVKEAGDEDTSTITYEQFAHWYTEQGGWRMLGWLELTDLRKLPWAGHAGAAITEQLNTPSPDSGLEAFGLEGRRVQAGSAEAQALGIAPSILYQFSLETADDDEEGDAPAGPPSLLQLSFEDCANLQRLLRASGLDGLEPRQLYATLVALAKQSGAGSEEESRALHRSLFNSLIKNLIPGARLSPDEQTFLTWHFNHFFETFDTQGAQC